jgi:hypothetical protein
MLVRDAHSTWDLAADAHHNEALDGWFVTPAGQRDRVLIKEQYVRYTHDHGRAVRTHSSYATGQTIAQLSDKQLTAPIDGSWSAKDILAHIAAWDR